jgi:hypothetical protein
MIKKTKVEQILEMITERSRPLQEELDHLNSEGEEWRLKLNKERVIEILSQVSIMREFCKAIEEIQKQDDKS